MGTAAHGPGAFKGGPDARRYTAADTERRPPAELEADDFDPMRRLALRTSRGRWTGRKRVSAGRADAEIAALEQSVLERGVISPRSSCRMVGSSTATGGTRLAAQAEGQALPVTSRLPEGSTDEQGLASARELQVAGRNLTSERMVGRAGRDEGVLPGPPPGRGDPARGSQRRRHHSARPARDGRGERAAGSTEEEAKPQVRRGCNQWSARSLVAPEMS